MFSIFKNVSDTKTDILKSGSLQRCLRQVLHWVLDFTPQKMTREFCQWADFFGRQK